MNDITSSLFRFFVWKTRPTGSCPKGPEEISKDHNNITHVRQWQLSGASNRQIREEAVGNYERYLAGKYSPKTSHPAKVQPRKLMIEVKSKFKIIPSGNIAEWSSIILKANSSHPSQANAKWYSILLPELTRQLFLAQNYARCAMFINPETGELQRAWWHWRRSGGQS